MVMVGDSENNDIFGASRIGIKSILIKTKKFQKLKANFTIKKIPEVLKILDELNK